MKKIISVGFLWLFTGCASIFIDNTPSYKLWDISGHYHLYSKKFNEYNKVDVKQYCKQHKEWETIRVNYTKQGKKYRVI
jgi:hypothetical protein|tara:strand:- start:441 stop:677 length:237 start_codon:yes stop_codon:yes gene_type:complete